MNNSKISKAKLRKSEMEEQYATIRTCLPHTLKSHLKQERAAADTVFACTTACEQLLLDNMELINPLHACLIIIPSCSSTFSLSFSFSFSFIYVYT